MSSKKICKPKGFFSSASSCENEKITRNTQKSLTIHKLNCILQEPKTIENLPSTKKVSIKIPPKILEEILQKVSKKRGFKYLEDLIGIGKGLWSASDDGINLDDMKSTPGPINKVKRIYKRYYKTPYGNLYLIFPDLNNKEIIVSSFSNSIKDRQSCTSVDIKTKNNRKKNYRNALGLNLLFKLDKKTLKKGVKINFRLHGLKGSKIPRFVFLSTHKNFSIKSDETPLLWKCRVIKKGPRLIIIPIKKIKSLSVIKANGE